MEFEDMNFDFFPVKTEPVQYEDIFDESYLDIEDMLSPSIKRESQIEKTIDNTDSKSSYETELSVTVKNSKKSIHHNFQKHTVTTLKKLIKMGSLYRNNSESSIIAVRMWDMFLQSGNRTKEILSVLYGSYSANDEITVKRFRENGFKEIIEQPEHLIRGAQDLLREVTVEELSSKKLEKHLQKRRIECKQNFKLYLNCFVQELTQGPLRQRLGKSKAKNIQQVLKMDEYFTF